MTDMEKIRILLDCVQFVATAREDEDKQNLVDAALETLGILGIEPVDPVQYFDANGGGDGGDFD